MTAELKTKLMAWASTHNLNWLVDFHNCLRGLFKKQLLEFERSENTEIEKKFYKSALNDYDRILHINTFLMMYSYLEEWLYICRKTYAPEIALLNGKGSLKRFKNVIKELGLDLSSKLWQDLANAEKIRDCLLHANGRLSMLKDPRKLRTIIESVNSGLLIRRDRVQISGEYLQRFNENITKLMSIMIKRNTQ
jgi:hypothetical protein